MKEATGQDALPSASPRIRSFVRRAGRMTDFQRSSYESLALRYCVPFAQGALDLPSLFPRRAPLVMEIGFGMGVATALIAKAMPDRDFLGVEVHRPGIGKLMAEMEAGGIDNLKIIEGDAVEVLQRGLGEGSLDGIHLFFPDPWPKKRHHKRRILQNDFCALAASRLRSGAYLYVVTDWEEYAQDALEVLSSQRDLVNSCDGFAERREWRPQTKFETKALAAGRRIWELLFIKR